MRGFWQVAALLALLALLPSPAAARPTFQQKKQMAQAQYESANHLRAQLEAKPENERSRHAYLRVIEAYHRVVQIAPSSTKAGASVLAEAEMRQEAGSVLGDEELSRSAVDRYKFLLHEYPDVQRARAEFNIAKIQQDDLGETTAAKASFEEFLRKHPQHRLTPEAQAALNEIEQPAKKSAAKDSKQPVKKEPAEVHPATMAVAGKPSEKLAKAPAEPEEPGPSEKPYGTLPRVTGIRYWSMPDSTRVAIDLESEVQFNSGRIPSPERIFFDLHDTRLAPELSGKSFVVDDGFLRKIRVGQFQRGLTRVVLEIDPSSEYTTSLQTHPARLFVDIRSKSSTHAVVAKVEPAPAVTKPHESPAARSQNHEPTPPVVKETVKTPAPAAKEKETVAKAPEVVHTAESMGPGTIRSSGSVSKPLESKPAESKSAEGKPAQADEVAVRPASASHIETASKPVEARTTAGTEIATAKLPPPPVPEKSPKNVDPKTKKSDAKESAPKEPASSHSRKGKNNAKDTTVRAREAAPDSDGQRSLIRALGLKIGKIVIDAGHGGHDTGTIGPRGLEEKDLVLDVALRLGKLLEQRLGADVMFTRQDDTFVPLESRTALANENQADLFISIHANSSRDGGARGVETYYLNFTSSEEALEVASRENAASDMSIHELQDLVKKIALKDKVEESREFATDVQRALHTGLSAKGSSMRDRGVKKAPFVVLIGANMPSVLAEISFVSNPNEEKRLQTPEWRQKIAESLYRGIARYADSLSGVKVAAKFNKTDGQ